MARLGRAFPFPPRQTQRQHVTAAGPTTSTATLDGALTPTGALALQVQKPLASTLGGFPAAGLAAYYKLDEASGTRADGLGANPLTDVNTVGTAPAKLGTNAAQFVAASSEYLSGADSAALSLGGTAMTIAAWVWLDSTASGQIVSKATGTRATSEYQLEYIGGFGFQWYLYGAGEDGLFAASAFAPAINAWHYVVAWYDPTGPTMAIQVDNGTVDSQLVTVGTPNDTATAFQIGRMDTTYWDGRIDEVGIWRRVLTAAERTALYGAGAGKQFAASELSGAITKSATRALPAAITPAGATAVSRVILAAFAGSIGGGAASALLTDLLAYWPLDESSGTRADAHGSADLAVEVGTPGGAAGKLGNATTFTVGAGLKYTGSALDLASTDSFSISVWVYPTSPSTYCVIVNQLGSSTRKIYLLTKPFAGELAVWDHFHTGFNLTLNTWQHIVYTYASGGTNTGTETYYVNNVQVGTRTGAVPAPDTGGLRVGIDDPPTYTNSWVGRLDELGFWRRVLTSGERTELYNGGAGVAYPFGGGAGGELAGALTRSVARPVAGALTPSGVLTKRLVRTLAAALTPVATLTRSLARTLSAALTPTAVTNTEKFAGLLTVSLTGVLTPTGTVTKRVARSVGAAMTPAGTLARQTRRSLAGALVPAGTLIKRLARSLAAALTPAGTTALTRVVLLALGGALAATGALGRTLGKPLAGAVTPAAALTRTLTRSLGGTVASAGELVRELARRLAGQVTPAGAVSSSAPSIDPPLDGPILAPAGARQYAAVAGASQSSAAVGASRAAADVQDSQQRATVRGSRYGAGVR